MNRAFAGGRSEAVTESRARARSRAVVVALALAIAGTGSAHAAGKGGAPDGSGGPSAAPTPTKSSARSKAKAAVERAQVDYKLGRFQDALEGYRRAYELYQAPLLLFDMGQCHRALGNSEKAIFFFEGYLREETRPEPDRRHLAEQLIAEARADLQHKMDEAAATPTPPLAPPPPPVQLRAVDVQRVVTTSLVTSPSERDRGEPPHRSVASRWWFWTAIGGACLVAAGAAVYYATGEPRLVRPTGSLGTIDAERPPASQ